MLNLLTALALELERPRKISAQVIKHLVDTHDVTREDIGAFLAEALPKLEDYEVDLVLSPLFTPSLAEQAVFAELLGPESIAPDQWPALIRQLRARPTCAQLVAEDGQTHRIPLRDVTIERYVHRLRLDATIPESLFKLLTPLPAADRPLLKAVARRAIWEGDQRHDILARYVINAMERQVYRGEDAVELLKLMETYEPADVQDLLARIPHWQQVLRQEINEATSPRPFFNRRVEELHGGGRDQRRHDNDRLTAKEDEQAFLDRLQRVLAG